MLCPARLRINRYELRVETLDVEVDHRHVPTLPTEKRKIRIALVRAVDDGQRFRPAAEVVTLNASASAADLHDQVIDTVEHKTRV